MTDDFTEIASFVWNPNRSKAAILLADGYSWSEVAKECDVTKRTIGYWCANEEFSAEVDRLSLMVGIASRAERLRIAKRVIRQRIRKDDEFVYTTKDALDWLKFAQGETDGIKLDLAALTEAAASMADTGQDRDLPTAEGQGPEHGEPGGVGAIVGAEE